MTKSSNPVKRELNLRIILIQPPPDVDYALLQGHGSRFQPIQIRRSNGNDLRFDFTIEVSLKSNSLAFAGPFVQGPADDRFVYIGVGTFAAQSGPWNRRLKIPLSGIAPQMIESAGILQATLPGTAKDGTPSCAYAWRKSVAPSWNWKVLR